MLYLSSGSKELFHSNFLFWLGNANRKLFEELLSRLCHINGTWPENWTVRREYKHLELCITYAKATGKTIKGKGTPMVTKSISIAQKNALFHAVRSGICIKLRLRSYGANCVLSA